MFKRGDIVSVNFPFSDGSGSKLRPALILSNNSIAGSGDVVVLMISSQTRTSAVAIELTPELLTNPLPKNSFVRCHQLYTIDQHLLLSKYGSVTKEGMMLIFDAVVSIIK